MTIILALLKLMLTFAIGTVVIVLLIATVLGTLGLIGWIATKILDL